MKKFCGTAQAIPHFFTVFLIKRSLPMVANW